jgi:hypothetical protein
MFQTQDKLKQHYQAILYIHFKELILQVLNLIIFRRFLNS